MSEHPFSRSGQPLSNEAASTMLRAAMSSSRRPVDALLERLEQPDGAAWLEHTLSALLLEKSASGTTAKRWCEGPIALDDLQTIKRRGTSAINSAITEDDRHVGMAAYFFSIAGALVYHHTLIGATDDHGKPRPDLRDVLLDIASAVEEPWSGMMLNAAGIVR